LRSDKTCGWLLFAISLGFFAYLLYNDSWLAVIALLGIVIGAGFIVLGVREFLHRVRVIGLRGIEMAPPAGLPKRPYFEETESRSPVSDKIGAKEKSPEETEKTIRELLEKSPKDIELLSALIDLYLGR